jgi:ABC-2 type transport system permease protein
MFRLIVATIRTQIKLSVRDWAVLTPVIVMPLQVLPAMAVFVASNRVDLAGYAITAALLFSIGQMCFSVSSEIVSNDRTDERLELLVATPASYAVVLGSRALVVSFLGLAGFAEAWLLVKLVFGIAVAVYDPLVLFGALIGTAIAGGGTAVLTAALFSLAKETRTIQNAVYGPFYLMSGILVPVTFLPAWLQVFSPFFFFYWSAGLVRDALSPTPIVNAGARVATLIGLGAAAAIIGALILTRMLERLRRDGRLGLA